MNIRERRSDRNAGEGPVANAHLASACAAVGLLLGVTAVSPAAAAGAGDNIVEIGWLHAQTLDTSQPLQTDLTPYPALNLLGVGTRFSSAGTGATIDNVNTVQLAAFHFFTDHFGIKAEAGLPPIFHLRGTGVVQPKSKYPLVQRFLPQVDIGAAENNPLASVRQWSPAVLAQYFFFSPSSRFRPNLGLGISYTWFTDISPNATFVRNLNNNFGPVLAIAAGKYREGPTHVGASASYEWAPIYNAGFSYDLTEHWGIVGSISYLPLRASAHITIFAADGTQLADSHAQVHLDPLASAVLVSYRF
jgi:outer membrane protein